MLLTALIVLLLACAILVGAWLVWRRPWAGARTRYPIVMAHGLFGFDEIRLAGLTQEYFDGVASHLGRLRVQVHRPRVPPVASIERRARVLADFIERLPARRVNIVAHSMGGLDARYAISKLGLARRVVSLTTVGTPHLGSRLADLLTTAMGDKLGLRRLWNRLGIEAMFELTTDRMRAFNREVTDVPRVRYFSVVGVTGPAAAERIQTVLRPFYAYLSSRVGPNDGLVSAASQRWGTVLVETEASHLDQIGWSSQFDAPAFYQDLATRLREFGL